jgi:hypothetical protein
MAAFASKEADQTSRFRWDNPGFCIFSWGPDRFIKNWRNIPDFNFKWSYIFTKGIMCSGTAYCRQSASLYIVVGENRNKLNICSGLFYDSQYLDYRSSNGKMFEEFQGIRKEVFAIA